MNNDFFDRPLPTAPYSEAAILSTAIIERRLPDCDLTPDDFHHPMARRLWRVLAAAVENREPLDPASLAARMGEDHAGYLASLLDGAIVSDGQFHAARLREASLRRRAIELARNVAESAYAGASPLDIAEAFSAAASEVGNEPRKNRHALTADQLDAEARVYAQNLSAHRTPTGLAPLDAVIGGVGRGQVLTILARTSVGKSAIAQNMVRAFLERDSQTSIAFCSAEMPATDYWIRQRQIEADADQGTVIWALKTGSEIAPGFIERADKRIAVIPNAYLKLSEIERILDRAMQRNDVLPVECVIFDYAKLFAAERSTRSDAERVGDIARGVKVLAKNMNVACVLLSQAGRNENNDGTRRVTLNDARDSGEIEEAADFMVGAWRPGMNKGEPREMRLAILKGRSCPHAEFSMVFEGRTLRITEAK